MNRNLANILTLASASLMLAAPVAHAVTAPVLDQYGNPTIVADVPATTPDVVAATPAAPSGSESESCNKASDGCSSDGVSSVADPVAVGQLTTTATAPSSAGGGGAKVPAVAVAAAAGPSVANAASRSEIGALPFTGFELGLLFIGGSLLLGSGILLSRIGYGAGSAAPQAASTDRHDS